MGAINRIYIMKLILACLKKFYLLRKTLEQRCTVKHIIVCLFWNTNMQIKTQYVLKNNKVLNSCPKIMQPSWRKRCEYKSCNYLAVGFIQRDRLEIKTKTENKGSANHTKVQHWFQGGQVAPLAPLQHTALWLAAHSEALLRTAGSLHTRGHARYPEKQLPLPPFRILLMVRLRCCCKSHRASMLPCKSRQWIMPLQVDLSELTLQFNSSSQHSPFRWAILLWAGACRWWERVKAGALPVPPGHLTLGHRGHAMWHSPHSLPVVHSVGAGAVGSSCSLISALHRFEFQLRLHTITSPPHSGL